MRSFYKYIFIRFVRYKSNNMIISRFTYDCQSTSNCFIYDHLWMKWTWRWSTSSSIFSTYFVYGISSTPLVHFFSSDHLQDINGTHYKAPFDCPTTKFMKVIVQLPWCDAMTFFQSFQPSSYVVLLENRLI